MTPTLFEIAEDMLALDELLEESGVVHAGKGGDGGTPGGGGGGGGASRNGLAAGAGGKGGDGSALVREY